MATQPAPTADEFFGPVPAGPAQQALPTADQFFAPPSAPSGSANDTIWSSVKSAGARILNSVGYGAQQGWGSEPLGLSPDTEQSMRKMGLFPDYEAGHKSFLQAFNNVTVRPVTEFAIRSAEAALETVGRGLQSGLYAAGSGAEQTAQEIQGSGDSTLRSAAALPFGLVSEQAGRIATGGGLESGVLGLEAGLHAASPTNIRMAVALRGGREAIESDHVLNVNRARATGVVGEGEAGFYGATEPTPENLQARTAAATEAGMYDVPQPLPPAADIHELARRVDPETFERYDALSLQRDTARDELARLGEERGNAPEIAAAQEKIDGILGKVNGVEDRLTNVQTERLTAARDELDRLHSADTPEMISARNRVMAADFEMRDLAPQVSEAYRNAEGMLPEGVIEAAAEPKVAEKPGTPEAGKPGTPRDVKDYVDRYIAGEGRGNPEMEQFAANNAGAIEQEFQARAGEQGKTPIPAAAASEAARATEPPNVLGGETLGDPGAANEGEAIAAAEGTTEPAKPVGRPVTANMKSIEGTGELKARGLSEGVEAKAIEDGLTETFGDLPEYRALNMAEQAQGVSKLIAEDYERARAIAMGERQPPAGLLPESVFVGVEKHALANGDIETLRQLGTRSRLSTAATTMGQRIRALGERDKASPVGMIQDVQAAREVAMKARNIDLEVEKASISADIKAEMKKAATVKPDAWESFLSAIKCAI